MINTDKTVAIRFCRGATPHPEPIYYMNGHPIQFVHSASDLGLLVDVSLKFHQHIRRAVNKASGIASIF